MTREYRDERDAEFLCEEAHYAFRGYMRILGKAARKHRQSALNQAASDMRRLGFKEEFLEAVVADCGFIDKCIDLAKIDPKTGGPYPAASGVRWDENGEAGYAWALYRVEDLPSDLLDMNRNSEDFARCLTGWGCYYRGAGRWFANEPYVSSRSKTKILVKQFRGLDI